MSGSSIELLLRPQFAHPGVRKPLLANVARRPSPVRRKKQPSAAFTLLAGVASATQASRPSIAEFGRDQSFDRDSDCCPRSAPIVRLPAVADSTSRHRPLFDYVAITCVGPTASISRSARTQASIGCGWPHKCRASESGGIWHQSQWCARGRTYTRRRNSSRHCGVAVCPESP